MNHRKTDCKSNRQHAYQYKLFSDSSAVKNYLSQFKKPEDVVKFLSTLGNVTFMHSGTQLYAFKVGLILKFYSSIDNYGK